MDTIDGDMLVLEILKNDIILDEPCSCVEWNRTGQRLIIAERFKDKLCPHCHNKRFLPTKIGQTLIKFFNRHGEK